MKNATNQDAVVAEPQKGQPTRRTCCYCGAEIPPKAHKHKRYCNQNCIDLASAERHGHDEPNIPRQNGEW